MASPTSALTDVSAAGLGSYAEARYPELEEGYAARQIFPVTPVAQVSGTFGKIELEEMLRADMNLERSPGAGYQRLQPMFTTATYACKEYGIEVPVDSRERAMYANFLDGYQFAVDTAIHQILEDAEKRLAALLFSTTWTGDADLSNAAGANWDSTGNPLTDVDTAKKDFFTNTGYYPNTILMNRKVFDAVRQNSNVTAAIASSGAGAPISIDLITTQQVAEALGVGQVVVAGGAKEGSTAGTAAYIWSDNAMLLRVATSGNFREPCIGRTMHYTPDGSALGGTVEAYREESIRSDVVRVRHDVDELLLHTQMGFIITGVHS